MSDATHLLKTIEAGDPQAAADLMPLVYDELRHLAAQRLAQEQPGQTLQPTALVHEAYLRLVGNQHFNSRGHFFAAAAEAMRRILVEQARRKGRVRHGGQMRRVALDDVPMSQPADEILDIHEALTRLEQIDPMRAELVKLRYFAGLTMPEVAQALGIALATAERHWMFARTWLYAELSGKEKSDNE